MTRAPRTVLLIDDDDDVRALLEALVAARPGYCVVGSVGAFPEAREPLANLTPQVVVIGSHRDGFEPMAAVTYVRVAVPEARIVLLEDLVDPITLLDALARGADTVLSSGAGLFELMPAVELLLERAAARGATAAA